MKETTKETLIDVLNVTATVLLCVASGAFFVAALLCDSISFINEHRTVLISLVVGLLFVVMLCGLLFYIFERKTLYRLTVCLILCIFLLGGMFYAISATGFIKKMTSIDALREFIENSGGRTVTIVVFILIQFLQVVILPIPSTVTVMAGVALFRPLECAIYSFIGIFTGSVVAFAVGRWLGYKVVCWIVGKEELDKWLKKIEGKDYLILSIMFLLPLFPDDILCFIAGLSSMTWTYYLVMVFITRALSIILSAYSFDSIPFNTWWGILIWVLIIAAVIALFYIVCKYSDKIDNFIKNKLGFRRHDRKKSGGKRTESRKS